MVHLESVMDDIKIYIAESWTQRSKHVDGVSKKLGLTLQDCKSYTDGGSTENARK